MLNTIAAWFTLVLYLLYAIKPWRHQLRRLGQRIHDWSMLLVLVPFLLATNLEPELSDLGIVALYILIPTLLLRLRPEKFKPFDLFHILTILAIWVPIEPDLFGVAQWVSLPDVTATLTEGVELPITLLTGLLMALHLFLVLHPLKDFEFTFRWKFSDLRDVFSALTVYSLIAIPIGLVMRFLVYELDIPASLQDGALLLLAGYLLTAVPEEVLFRGIIQNTLSQRLTNQRFAWVISSVIFGLAHANNATPRFPEPNWGYVVMATIAGLAYGWVYHRTKKVTASAITHALVNFVWGIVFAG